MVQNKKYPLSVLTGIPSFGPMRNLGKIFSPSLFPVLFFKKSTRMSPVHYKWSHVEISESGIKKEWNDSNLIFLLRIEGILESPRELGFEGVGGWTCVVWKCFSSYSNIASGWEFRIYYLGLPDHMSQLYYEWIQSLFL